MGWRALACIASVLTASNLLAGMQPPSCTDRPPQSLERAACYARLRQWKDAEETYRVYLRTHADSVPAALGHAEALLRLGFVVESSQEVKKLIQAHPDEPAVCKLQAWLLANMDKEPRAAEQSLTKVTQTAPGDADAWSLLGSFYLDSHRVGEGIRCFERAVALNPANPLYRAGLGRGYAAAGRDADAAKAFSAALELARGDADPSIFLWYGDFLAGAQRYQESGAAYSRAIALDPADGEPWMRRAAVETKAGRYGDAERDVLEARKRGASERKVQTLLVPVYKGMGDDAKAQAAADAVDRAAAAEEERRVKWRTARAALDAAERLIEENHFSAALPLYVRVTEDVPDYADAWLAAGVCYAQTGDAAHAEQSFRTFLRLQPLSPEGHSALGVLLLSEQRTVEARAELQEALRLDPGSAEAKEALDALRARRQ